MASLIYRTAHKQKKYGKTKNKTDYSSEETVRVKVRLFGKDLPPGSFDEFRLSPEVAANPQTKPTDLDCESARKTWQLPSTIAILLLLSPRADTHFTVSRRVEAEST